jgi:tRNA threonylcarbamoyl adenosine modification protein YjeE
MMDMKYTSRKEGETAQIAANFSKTLIGNQIVCLCGDLGAGKSVFARALIRALSDDPDLIVPSPTYTLVETYETPLGTVNHFDLYRLKSPEEIYDLGWDDMIGQSICVIEWPERLEQQHPKLYTQVTITAQNETLRNISIEQLDKKG